MACWLVVFGFNEGSARVYFSMSYITSWNALCIFHQVLAQQNHQLPWSVFALVWTSSPSQRNPRPSSFSLGAFPGRRVLPSVTGSLAGVSDSPRRDPGVQKLRWVRDWHQTCDLGRGEAPGPWPLHSLLCQSSWSAGDGG